MSAKGVKDLTERREALLRRLFGRRAATRAEIARDLRFRKSTITALCNQLLAEGVLVAVTPERKRNVLLKLNPERFVAVGVQHAEKGLYCVTLDADLAQPAKRFAELGEDLCGGERLARISGEIAAFVRDCGPRSAIVGVGFCDIGMVDVARGRSIRAAAIPDWNDMPIRESIERATGLRTAISLHSESLCLAEKTFGAGQDMDAFIFIQAGRRIGVSVLLNGDFLRGNTNFFGELGHTVVAPSGEICKCGNRGCLETVAGAEAIMKKVSQNATPDSAAAADFADGQVTIDAVVAAARNGNKLARLAVEEAAQAIGAGAAFIINILGINNLVVGGKLTEVGDLVLDAIRNAISRNCVHPINESVTVRLGPLGDYGSAAGAAATVLRDYFSEPSATGRAS